MKISYELKDGYVFLWANDAITFSNICEITSNKTDEKEKQKDLQEKLKHFNDNYGDYKQVGNTLQYDDKHNFKAKLESDRVNRLRAVELKTLLIALTEDIVQSLAGEVVPNIERRKQLFIEYHNELRVLEGKEPRESNEI